MAAHQTRRAARSRLDPNLATAPFVNARPVERLSWLLWILALAVGGAAYWSTASARQEAGARRAEIGRLSTETLALRERATELRAGLEGADLAARIERTEFLNQRIAERAFSWNDLIDALGEVLPRGVRLRDLSPEGFAVAKGGRRANQTTPATSRVTLRIAGEAEEGEALLEFVDRLYRHPAFNEPNLARESTKKDQQIEFSLGVNYVPSWRSATGDVGGTVAQAATAAAPGGPADGTTIVPQAPAPAPASGASAAASVASRDGTFTALTSPGAVSAPKSRPQPGGAPAPVAGASRRYVPPAGAAGARGERSAWGESGGTTAEETDPADSSSRDASGSRAVVGEPSRALGETPNQPAMPVLPAPLRPFASAPPVLR